MPFSLGFILFFLCSWRASLFFPLSFSVPHPLSLAPCLAGCLPPALPVSGGSEADFCGIEIWRETGGAFRGEEIGATTPLRETHELSAVCYELASHHMGESLEWTHV